MEVYQGVSNHKDPATALEDAVSAWYDADCAYDIVFVFHSTQQDGEQVAKLVGEKFPNSLIAGCSTAGEYSKGDHYNGSLTIAAIRSPKTRWSVAALENIRDLNQEHASQLATQLLSNLAIDRLELNPEKHFAITFIDGLSLKEESCVSYLVDALEGIPFLGGSAGDDLAFQCTSVIANGKSLSNAAVVVMVETEEEFRILKHQHFRPSSTDLVMTEVDEPTRKVLTIDGFSAAERYAEAIGKQAEDLNSEDFSLYPLIFENNGELFVRSIQTANPDGSLTFYCAIEKGLILNIGTHNDMVSSLKNDLKDLERSFKSIQLFLMCNCILRSLEASSKDKHESLGKVLKSVTPNIVGFDTYGEQLNGLHINQTLVALAIGEAA